MTLGELLSRADSLRHNVYPRETKLVWLRQLELLARQYLDGFQGTEGFVPRIRAEAPDETNLMLPESYDAMYLYWLEFQMDYAAREYTLCGNAMEMFRTEWERFTGDIGRKYPAKTTKIRYF